MEGLTLNVESCDSSICKLRMNFDLRDLGDRLSLLLLDLPSLKYKINVTNEINGYMKTFSHTSQFDHQVSRYGEVVPISLRGIVGNPEDQFDIQVTVYKVSQNDDLIYCTRIKLLHQRILKNRSTRGPPSAIPASYNSSNNPRRSTVSVTGYDSDSVRLRFQLDSATYTEILKNPAKLPCKIEVENITQDKMIIFLPGTISQGITEFTIPLEKVPGYSNDDFDIIVNIFGNVCEQSPKTCAKLQAYKKLLLLRQSDQGIATGRELVERIHRAREEQRRKQREDEAERLIKQREVEERIALQQYEERLRKQRQEAEERMRRQQEEEAERQLAEIKRQARRRRLVEQYELLKRQQEEEKLRIQRQNSAELRRQREKDTYDRILYNAEVTVKSTTPRQVSVSVQFDANTYNKLLFETREFFGDNANLQFELTATNTQAFFNKQQVFQYTGRVSITNDLPLDRSLIVGDKYTFKVDVKKFSTAHGCFTTFLSQTVEHKEVLLKSELQMLMKKANIFRGSGFYGARLAVKSAYRNKPSSDFLNIQLNRGNIMEVYKKDNNGDPGCPINGQIKGLFFAIRPDPSRGRIPDVSPFGSRRIIIPIEKLVQTCPNFFFADFYCINKYHYVTLVATKPNSQVDKFCQDHLLEVNLDNNPFFYRENQRNFLTGMAVHEYYCCYEPRVEILFTEDINLNDPCITWDTVRTIGRGSSSTEGIPKRSFCDICNLKRPLGGNLNSL